MQQFHHLNVGIYGSVKDAKGVKDIGLWASMVLLNYQNFIEMTSNMIYTVALGVGLKCPRKIHLNTQWGGGVKKWQNSVHVVVE